MTNLLQALMDKISSQIIDIINLELKNPEQLVIHRKTDNTLVTNIDRKISQLILHTIKSDKRFSKIHLFCEEADQERCESVQFPAFIVDPIDGTKQLTQRYPECAISIALMFNSQISDAQNQAYIFNPFTGFEMNSWKEFHFAPKYLSLKKRSKLNALVSSSEWKDGLFKKLANDDQSIDLMVSGSIAQKLALLAAGIGDCVVSLRPKSLWDIAAGTILLKDRGFSLYIDGQKMENLDQEVYQPPFLWCFESDFSFLKKILGTSKL